MSFSDKNYYIKKLYEDIIFLTSVSKYIEDINTNKMTTIENLK